MTITKTITERLSALADPKYQEFQAKLVPTISPESILGVRLPAIRSLARGLTSQDIDGFLAKLPHKYYDENMLHSVLISKMRDFEHCLAEVERFLPYVDNWAVCDILSPKCFEKRKNELIPKIDAWLSSGATYTVRFGICRLMCHFLDEDFNPHYLEKVASVRSDEYYVNMMIAWYFATALAKQWDAAVVYIENRRLDPWTHNKSIQKACESYRVSSEQKEYLRSLKIKVN